MNPKLIPAKDSVNITYNFFDFLTILYDRDMLPNKVVGISAVRNILNFSVRQTPEHKRVKEYILISTRQK